MEVGSIWARLGVEYGEWRSGLREAGNQMREFSRQVQAGMQELGRAMAALGASISAGMGVAVKQFSDFESQMRNVNSIVKDSEEGFKRLSDTLLAMPAKEGLTQGPRELAAALYDISSSGFEGEKGLNVLKAAAKAADAGMTTAAVSAKGLTGLLNAYSLTAEDAAHVSDVMFKTVEKGVVTFPELANSIGNVASTAATAGIKIEELMAGIAALTLKGIKPDEAVTALNGAITKLAAATPEARKLMKQLGIEVDETTLKQKGLAWAINEVYTRTGGSLGGITRIMGDERAAKAVMALGKDPEKMGEFTKANMNATGSTESALAEQKKSLLKQMEMMRAQMEVIFVKIGKTLAPYVEMAVGLLKEFQQAWDRLSAPVQQGIVLFTALAGAAATVAGGLILLAPSISAIVSLFSGGALTAASAAVGASLASLAPVVLGLGAAAAALYVAWTDNWGGIREKTQAAAETIKGYLQTAFTWVKEELPRIWAETWQSIRFTLNRVWTEIQPGLDEFVSGVTSIWESFKPMIPGIIAAFQVLWEALKAIFATIYGQWEVMWTAFKGVLSVVWPLIVGTVKAQIELVKGVVAVVMDLIQGNWGKAWNRMKETLGSVWGAMATAVKSAINNMLSSLTETIGSFANVGERLMEAFAQGITRGKKAVDDAAATTAASVVPGLSADARNGVITMPLQPGGGLLPSPLYKEPEAPPPIPTPVADGGKKPDNSARATLLAANFQKTQALLAEGDAKKKAAPKTTMLDTILSFYPGSAVTSGFYESRGVSQYRTAPGRHNGYDIAMPKGSTVVASWPGIVRQIVPLGPAGEYGVVVDSGTFSTQYNHIKHGVTAGTTVSAGQVIGRTMIDHLDVKLKDNVGKYIDPKKTTDKTETRQASSAREAGNATRAFLQLKVEGTDNAFERQRADIEEKFRKAIMGVEPGSKEEAEVISRKEALLSRINQLETRSQEDLSSRLERLRAESADTTEQIVDKEIGAVKDRYRSLYRELEDQAIRNPAREGDIRATQEALAQAEKRELGLLEIQKKYLPELMTLEQMKQIRPERSYELEQQKSAIMIAAAKERVALLIDIDGVASESARKAMAEVMTIQDGVLQRAFEHNAKLREMHQITLQEQISLDGAALNSFVGTEEAKNQYRLQYQELFKQHLAEQQALSMEDEQTFLQRMQENLLQADQALVSNQTQLAVVQDMLRAQRLAKLQAEKQAIVAVGQQMASAFEGFLVNVGTGQQKFNDAFKSLWKSITDTVIKYVADMIIKVLALQKIMNAAFGWLTGGIGSIFGGIFGGAGGVISFTEIPGLPAIAHTGGVVIPGGIQSFHTGGIAGSTLRSDEVLAKLQVGEMVLSRAQVAAIGRGGGAAEQPAIFSPSISFSGDVHVHSEADMDRLAATLAQRMREEWQAW